jgi:predicted heme/steroid binding protein
LLLYLKKTLCCETFHFDKGKLKLKAIINIIQRWIMKACLIRIAAALTVILVFTGCSSSEKPSPTAAATPSVSTAATTPTVSSGNPSAAVSADPAVSPSAVSASPSAVSSERVFTLDELKTYNGQNGNPAYVAVNGIVYDVTGLKGWNKGSHDRHTAGTDFTDILAQSPHGDRILSGLKIVGTLQK